MSQSPGRSKAAIVVVGAVIVLIGLVIVSAVFYVGVVRPTNAVSRLEAAHDVDGLIRLLRDERGDKAALAARSLGTLRDARSVRPLRERFASARIGTMLWCESGEALAKFGDTASITHLVRNLGTDHCTSRARPRFKGPTGELERAGQATVPFLVAALPDLQRGSAAAAVLQGLGWRPSIDSERVHFWAASGDAAQLRQKSDITRQVLAADLTSNDPATVENAATISIRLGVPGMRDMLIETLDRSGHKPLAEIMLNSGEPTLAKAAKTWADRNGYETELMSGSNRPSWNRW